MMFEFLWSGAKAVASHVMTVELLVLIVTAAGVSLIAAIRSAGRWLDDVIFGDGFYGDEE